ncbi:trans-sulfuration enzyme family protein [Acuticoccus mangrovi]|uniref:PLP-dependent transferase n=1 Tax=Acuticoccus mangrovi TaxID=2796142 RepID=A0A934INB9_9HYPH|nr:PLP-dependent transferase [Acuticoccus mangrovi]MBJ3775050.1 PLP-dependent transferase [Acuticoccus mangrovi]
MSFGNVFRRETVAAHAAGAYDHATGGLVSAWQPSTTFLRDADYRLPASGDLYRRDHNPTTREAEAVIGALEGGRAALFGSGQSAISALMRAYGTGPVAVQTGGYYGTQTLAARHAANGLRVATFAGDRFDSLLSMLERERPALVIVETPSNPFLDVVDIARAAEAVHAAGGVLAVDSTAATPILTRPLEHGADIVIHSATKALNGHSDVLAGALVVGTERVEGFETALATRAAEGCVLSPFDAWLLTRGMRTLHLRVAAMSRSALAIATFLAAHPKVERVRYPGLADHPAHAAAARQMTGGFGGLVSFDVAGGAAAALAVAGRLALIRRATSLGGVESVVEHRHSIEPASTGMPEGLLRLSVGIEATEDLITDLDQSLAALP